MPFVNGTYVPPVSSWNPATENQEATPDDWNNLLTDIANALTSRWALDGTSQVTANIPMSGAKFTGLGVGTDPNDSVRLAQLGSYQPLDAGLTALAALTGAGFLRATGTDTYVIEDAAAHRAALGLGSMALQGSSAVNITGGTISGSFTGSITMSGTVTGSS